MPVIFDNFIWFTDEQLFSAVRREVPAFSGRVPAAGKMTEAITRALQQLLTEQKIAGAVEYTALGDLSGQTLGHVFSVTGIKMPTCNFHFPGARNISEAKLGAASKEEIADTDYSRELIRGLAGSKLFSMYREVGQLRAKFGAATGKPDPACKNGVEVTIPVDEGLIYSLGRVDWSGASALTADELNKTLGVNTGEVVNGLKFDKGLLAVTKAYGRQGYLTARTQATPEFDDSAQKVTYRIDILEGPQYRMGGLLFKGLTERDAKALRGAWSLRRGEVFDMGYVMEDFFRNDLGNALRNLYEERQALGKPPPRVDVKLHPNKETLSVDVTLELAN